MIDPLIIIGFSVSYVIISLLVMSVIYEKYEASYEILTRAFLWPLLLVKYLITTTIIIMIIIYDVMWAMIKQAFKILFKESWTSY